MSVKKLLLLGAAGIASLGMTAALAGGPDMAPAPDSGVYVGVSAGYAIHDIRSDMGSVTPSTAIAWNDRARGGFSFGADIGYQFNRYVAAEFGYWYLPDARATLTARPGFAFLNTATTIKSYALYLAAKVMVPLYDSLDVFMKGGLAYRNSTGVPALNAIGVGLRTTVPTFESKTIEPMFAGGLAYHFDENWSVNVQYTYLGSVDRSQIPAAHIFTGGVEYMFAL